MTSTKINPKYLISFHTSTKITNRFIKPLQKIANLTPLKKNSGYATDQAFKNKKIMVHSKQIS